LERRYLVSSESVTEGHPDKLADQISDGVLDAILEKDPMGRVACETLVTTGLVVVAGEITTQCYVDIPRLARSIVKDIGYTRAKYGFDGDTCAVVTAIDEQSPDICQGVNRSLELREGEMSEEEINKVGAGDQGMMVGYACDETEEFLPLPIALAHRLARRLSEVRKDRTLGYLRPDGKTQVTIEYIDGKAIRVDTVVVSAQHHPAVEAEQIRNDILREVITPVLPAHLTETPPRVLVNPTGRFVMGGPMADTGLTGRKIIIDTYGGVVPHGGRGFFREGSHKGGPVRCLYEPLCSQERGGRRAGKRMQDPGGLCNRRCKTCFFNGRYKRQRDSTGPSCHGDSKGTFRLQARSDNQGSRPEKTSVQKACGLRPYGQDRSGPPPGVGANRQG